MIDTFMRRNLSTRALSFLGLSARNERGFTLIELLVVIAIIGILSAVVLASLSNSRAKARIAAAQSTMHTIQSVASTCLIDGNLNLPASDSQNGGGGIVCPGGNNYVNLPSNWTYCDITNTGTCGVTISSRTGTPPAVTAYSIVAKGDSKTITCTDSGCVTN